MTPEELNRKMEFIVEVQARTSVTLEMMAAQHAEFEKWSRNVIEQLAIDHQRMVEVMRIQSNRLDRSEQRLDELQILIKNSEQRLKRSEERLERAEAGDKAAQQRHEELLKEMRASFDRVLEKLTEKLN